MKKAELLNSTLIDDVLAPLWASGRSLNGKLGVAEIITALPTRSIGIFGRCSVRSNRGQCSLLSIPDNSPRSLTLSLACRPPGSSCACPAGVSRLRSAVIPSIRAEHHASLRTPTGSNARTAETVIRCRHLSHETCIRSTGSRGGVP